MAGERTKPRCYNLILSTSSCVKAILRAVIKFGRARAFMRRHGLLVLKRTAVAEIGADA